MFFFAARRLGGLALPYSGRIVWFRPRASSSAECHLDLLYRFARFLSCFLSRGGRVFFFLRLLLKRPCSPT